MSCLDLCMLRDVLGGLWYSGWGVTLLGGYRTSVLGAIRGTLWGVYRRFGVGVAMMCVLGGEVVLWAFWEFSFLDSEGGCYYTGVGVAGAAKLKRGSCRCEEAWLVYPRDGD